MRLLRNKTKIGNVVAIYHLSVKPICRSAGRSATAAAAYRAACLMVDERTGLKYDYRRKGGVLSSDIVLPIDAPAWATNRSALWNAAESAEKRKDACVAREFEVALPWELSRTARRNLVLTFAKRMADEEGCAVDASIHAPDDEGDDRNEHAHILRTTRKIGEAGLGEKLETEKAGRKRKDDLEKVRELWEKLANAALENAGHQTRIDRRTLEAQGIDREPSRHLGPAATGFERKTGKDSDKREGWNDQAAGRATAVAAVDERIHALASERRLEAARAEAQTLAEAAARAEAQERIAAKAKAAEQEAARAEVARITAEAEALEAARSAAAQEAAREEAEARAEAAAHAAKAEAQARAQAARETIAKVTAEAAARKAERTAAASALVSVLEAVKTVKQLAETKAALVKVNEEAIKIKEQMDRAEPAQVVRQARAQVNEMRAAILDKQALVKDARIQLQELPWWRLITKRFMSVQIDASQAQLTAWSMEYREVKKTAQAPVREELTKRKAELDQGREKLLKQRDELIEKISAEEALNANPDAGVKPR